MVKNIIIILMLAFLAGCSVTKKVERRYEGNGRELLLGDFGEPQKVVNLDNGRQKFIYIRETFVRATEIGTGKGTLDPRISPGFVKVETFEFIIDANGVVVGTDYERKEK